MAFTTEKNKGIVLRFNREVIEQGNIQSFHELVGENVVNHSAPAGAPNGPESMHYFLMQELRVGFPNIKVEILDQIAEGNKVMTRKTLHGTHTGTFLGIPASNRKVAIEVIDIIRIEEDKYAEHWAISNIPEVLKEISGEYYG
jgi:predicted ester cyclase